MTPEYLSILVVIAFFSVVQSMFGMGLLIFGTPTLLLMGHDFITTLGYLLPPSCVISFLQVFTIGRGRTTISRYLYLLCLPGIGAGLWLADSHSFAPWINMLVGITLLLAALVGYWPPLQRLLSALLDKHLPLYHLTMGLTHGLTNLGGALLAVLASGQNRDKEAIRYTVAHYYLVFGCVQMIVLVAVIGHTNILANNILAPIIAALVYMLIGRVIFSRSSNQTYSTALNMFIAAYGITVLAQFWS